MKIDDLRLEKSNGSIRAAAKVVWEDNDRPPQEIFFETTETVDSEFFCEPAAFLVACVLPAMHHGEERVFIDAEICPLLQNGLTVAMNWFNCWFERHRKIVPIEAKRRANTDTSKKQRNAAIFFSGGIDSLSALRYNHLTFPKSHPWYIRDGIIIYGQNIESDNRPETFDKALSALREVSNDAGIALVPIMTNVRELEPDTNFFMKEFHGAIMAAAAHALIGRISIAYIAASESIQSTLKLHNVLHFQPYGSHPLIDPNYGSSDLRIHHYGVELSRLDKTRMVADWPIGLQNIKVCQENWPGENCGRCEKCIRTMLALIALDRLDQTRAFKENDLSESSVQNVYIQRQTSANSYTVEDYYLELIPALSEKKRYDLVRGIKRIINESRYVDQRSLRARVSRYDEKYLGGALSKLKRVAQRD
jgi:hypothetical protein